jgi:hypothetical protein
MHGSLLNPWGRSWNGRMVKSASNADGRVVRTRLIRAASFPLDRELYHPHLGSRRQVTAVAALESAFPKWPPSTT